MKRSKTVEQYIADHGQWRDELVKLREVVLGSGLQETIKWGAPVYTLDGKNVVGIGAFKRYFGLWFFQGALLDDSAGVLINAQEGKTKALRQWRMTSRRDIKVRTVRSYLKQAIDAQRSGREIKPERSKTLEMPDELEAALRGDRRTKGAFEKLTPGRQREYASYVSEAKRADTRARRVEKILPMIAAGKGLNDKYRGC